MKNPHVPYGKSVHGEDEIAAVLHVLRTSTQMGPHVRKMEAQIAELFDKKFGIMVNSGSSANYLSIELLSLPEGGEVITPALTFSTTVAPLIKNRLIPAFVDVEPNTFNIDADAIEAMVSSKTVAMMIPNLLGNLPHWQQLREIADRHRLIVIEDSADTVGATFGGYSTGHYSDLSTTSFYGSHIINCAGNGGLLAVNEERFASRAKLLRSWGRSSSLFVESEAIENRFNVQVDAIDYDAKFIFEAIGYNLEPSEMGAAFGLVQLAKLQENIDIRRRNFQKHINFFKAYEEWFHLPEEKPLIRTGWLAFPLRLKEGVPFSRKELQIFLEKRNIQTRTIFTGNILRQPGFKTIPRRETRQGYPNTDAVMKNGMLIACHQGVTEEMMTHLHASFTEFMSQKVSTALV